MCAFNTVIVCFFVASLGVVSNPLGAIMSGVFMQTIGRKTTVQLTSIPFLIGWMVIGMSTDVTYLCLGRFITGVAIGKSCFTHTYTCRAFVLSLFLGNVNLTLSLTLYANKTKKIALYFSNNKH